MRRTEPSDAAGIVDLSEEMQTMADDEPTPQRVPLAVASPPKAWADVTDAELEGLAAQMVGAMREQIGKPSPF